jgi:L-ectoine synthase
MIIRRVGELRGTDREVEAPTWVSRRLLLARDGMGFSLHETVLRAGTETEMHYKNHLEAVYCVGGEGEVQVLPEGPAFAIRPGTLYALDAHDHHVLRAKTDLRMVCVFNPPLVGPEVHGEDGSYPILEDPS